MTNAKRMKDLALGQYPIRILGMKFILKKEMNSFPSVGYRYSAGDNIIIHCDPVYQSLLLLTHKDGIGFERKLTEDDFVFI